MDEKKIKVTKYQNVPLDKDSYRLLESLCERYGLGKRAKGAFVGRLLREENRKLDGVQGAVLQSGEQAQ